MASLFLLLFSYLVIRDAIVAALKNIPSHHHHRFITPNSKLNQIMALETWLIKVKNAVSNKLDVVRSNNNTSTTTAAGNNMKAATSCKKSSNVGVLAFEIAGLMSKLLHLWQSVSDDNIHRLRNHSISLEGVHKIVSNDDSFLLGLACAEITENLRLLALSLSPFTPRCSHPDLRAFDRFFHDFANSGRDQNNWVRYTLTLNLITLFFPHNINIRIVTNWM